MANELIQPILKNYHDQTPMRAWSLVVTLFGDVVVPRGGALWLGSLLEITSAIGIDPGIIRVAMHRLAKDGWLVSHKVGRRAFYQLTDGSSLETHEASKRIYNHTSQDDIKALRMFILGEGRERAKIRKMMLDDGWGHVAKRVIISPLYSDLLEKEKRYTGDCDLTKLNIDTVNDDIRALCSEAWLLDDLNAQYDKLVGLYRPILVALKKDCSISPLEALIIRGLLIHDYRRIVLKDPFLPKRFLVKNWTGHKAQKLVGELYHLVLANSEKWLDTNGINSEGQLPAATNALSKRFMD